MSEYTLSVVQLCPDAWRAAANAVAEAAGYGSNNLSVQLVHTDGSTWWGCHAWWIPEVFEMQMASTDPQVIEVLSHVITSTRDGGVPLDHWYAALAANNLSLPPEEA